MGFQVAYVPIGVGTFHLESAQDQFEKSIAMLKGLNADCTVPEKMLLTINDLDAYLDTLNPDLIVLQNITFANAAYASEVLKRFACPIVLWTLREPVIDGTRLRLNSLTGAYSAGNAITAFRGEGKFEYIFGAPGEAEVEREVGAAIRAAKVKYDLRRLKMISIGHTPQGFGFGRALDAEMMSTFGTTLDSIEARELINKAKGYTEEELADELAEARKTIVGLEAIPENNVVNFARLYKAYKSYVGENHIGALCSRCWPDFFTEFGTPVCSVLSLLNANGVSASCESDAYGALSMFIGSDLPSRSCFFGDPVSMNEKEGTITFWHCGMAACDLARKDTGAVLSADGVSVVMPVEQAQNRPTTPEMIEKSLRKTGGTPFYIENMRIEVQDGLMIPASVMNGMRRDALDLLLAKRGVAPSRDWLHGSVLPRDDETAAREGFRGYTATVRTKAQADALRELGLETVYVPLEVAAQTGLPAILPRVFSDNEQPQIEMLLGEAMSRGTDTVLAGNIGHIPLAKRLGFTVHGDFGLNAYNSKTLSALAEMGVSRQTLSFEARLAQIRDMRGPLETDLIVYGRLPLMIFENCAIRRQHGGKCSCQNGVTYLTDRRRERFPLLNEFGCRNTLLNSRPLCLREDFARLGVQTARLQFTIESPEECVRIARAFLSGAPLDGEFTNGLYKRGVE